MPKVVHCKDGTPSIYVGRQRSGMHFGNVASHRTENIAEIQCATLADSIRIFDEWLDGKGWGEVAQERRQWILDNLTSLRGHDLSCWCVTDRNPRAPCHGWSLLRRANAEVVHFNSYSQEWGWLSNFAPSPITDKEGRVYPTAEHAYQAVKCANPAEREAVRTAPTAKVAKQFGKSVTLIANWEKVKVSRMKSILRCKFKQNEQLRNKLLATGDSTLVHESSWDSYWGNGRDGRGQNVLGQLIMEIREELNSAPPAH